MMREKHASAPAVPSSWNNFGHGAAQHKLHSDTILDYGRALTADAARFRLTAKGNTPESSTRVYLSVEVGPEFRNRERENYSGGERLGLGILLKERDRFELIVASPAVP